MSKYNLLFSSLEDIKLKSMTKANIKNLKKLGINSLYDLFYYFPKSYENSAVYKKIIDLRNNDSAIVKGKIISVNRKYLFNKKLMVTMNLVDDTGILELIWFNNKYIFSSIKVGDEIIVSSKAKVSSRIQMVNPSYKKTKDESILNKKMSLEPIYPLTKGINQNKLRSLIKDSIDKFGYLLQENIPLDFLYDNKIISRNKAITNIHFPENDDLLNLSIRRFTYEEIIVLEANILKNKFLVNKNNKKLYFTEDNKKLVKEYLASLSFELTNAQKKVITTIYKEIRNGKIINRLIQGDVGSGKTIVALIMMLYMAENNYQTCMMAPTEILAIQHYNNIINEFLKLNIRVELLTSSTKSKKRKEILNDLKDGKIDILIGTHSLINDDIVFSNLALTIIDEQHRFGVEQRNKLREKSQISNVIYMSATPIPRSLALTIYGDLDVSIIDELPSGRKKIKTKYIKDEEDILKMNKFCKTKLKEGTQMYVVAPLIEKSEKLAAKSSEEIFEEIKEDFPEFKVALLHGKIKNSEKDEIINAFKDKKYDILVSTSVIEVGINIPNANIMIIKSAERFGLSSLHQLRGRVGRSNQNGYCFLEATNNNEITEKRLSILEKTTDGFVISEEDLKLRNSGEIFGTRQSGISDLVLLDIVENIKEITEVKDFIQKYLEEKNGNIENEYLLFDMEYKKNKKEG
ncbi:ATP-dependent DNA helicase RecG [Oceanivirga miroungae]|uniref:ATP-dependent DNA helicase RecG n=1 Tax=Oceanivirga miroungae TaxID=1130046 RepID=A0A6I8MCS9_9FUSO|nr:ATP-dependent DNA helicase RecG [Oceanivirga miroungae]VWL84916.1 ATP-dependent DNA helicase RecG [Oceanivirga miroungae]